MIRVMLIDDHPVVRAGLRAILDSFEDITVVAEGAEGPRPGDIPAEVDVVVMDIQMPGTDGIAATKALHAAGGPPVLILTTYDAQADIVAALSAGALGYLLKDAPEEELHRAVVATARGQRTLSPEVATALAERLGRPQESLSARETEILRALETGATNRQLADSLFISLGTVKTHLLHIYQKLGVDNRTAAIAAARQRRLI
ncbi:response regulator transcription factor [Corynebacterium mastitidis]|uniref:DNA-binding response regulator n=1 Tax=Corynebacterium mastitidis TaxID=161890 RepID=A0A2N0X5X9_9CORY|nr:response regulator transcription factor [Corynebacterium mastitidis]MCH6196961.1 response regulator transcription factor [Corynebacterium mastitidis]PKF68091.1 DNA-binding response regulator [Corynebacterium mastitidis]